MRRRARPRRPGPAARGGARSGRQRRHHLHPGRPARRRGHQRRRDGGARAVAPRRAAAADLGVGLGHAGIRSGATLPAARRRAHRPVRATPLGDQRGAARPAAVRPPRLCPGRPRHRGARPASAVPARLRYQPRRRRRLPGQRRLDAGAVGRGLRAGRPARGRARHPRPVRADRAAARLAVGAGAAAGADRRRARSRPRNPWWWCSARASTPRPRSTRRTWPACWASRWWRAPTWWCATASCGCGRWARSSASTWCCAGWTPNTPTRWTCAPTRGSAWSGWSRCCAAAR